MLNFFLGMMFIYILLPILENFVNVICAYFEVLKAKCSLKISEYNNKISKNELDFRASTTRPMGFQYIETEEDEEDYEE